MKKMLVIHLDSAFLTRKAVLPLMYAQGGGSILLMGVDKQIPEQAAELGISEEAAVKDIMLGGTVTKEFTTIDDVADVALMFATFPTNALTGQSLLVSHGWHME